jgi:Flp pilus assembly protein TadG
MSNFEFTERCKRFSDDEEGTGTVFSIFGAAMFIIIGGTAIDGSNFWRSQQHMQQAKDVAAHAGVVQLAMNNTGGDAKTGRKSLVESNMPSGIYGSLYADQATDITVLHYDDATTSLSVDGKPNAVRVRLHRDQASGNPVQTFAPRLSDLFLITEKTKLSEWNLEVQGVAALAKFQGCSSTDGIYAKEQFSFSSSSTMGHGYCLHSQDTIWMSRQNTILPTAGLSMPNIDTCGNKCSDSAHALEDIGINTSALTGGSVVVKSQTDFESLSQVPEGLTNDVSCAANGSGPNAG